MAARSTSRETADQAGKMGQQLERQIVDAVISQILKSLERRSFARAGDSGNDHQLLDRLTPRSSTACFRGRAAFRNFPCCARACRGVMGFMLHREGSNRYLMQVDSGPGGSGSRTGLCQFERPLRVQRGRQQRPLAQRAAHADERRELLRESRFPGQRPACQGVAEANQRLQHRLLPATQKPLQQ